MKLRTALVAGAFAVSSLFTSMSAAAEPQTLAVDLSHTRATFTVSHLGFSTMPGVFRVMDAKLTYDEAKPENSSLEVTINADSVDMFNDGLNAHLKNADFFNVAVHPTITFRSTRVESTGPKTARVTGDFTMLGVTKPVSFDVTLNQAADHPMRRVRSFGFGATGVVKRSEFGMTKFVPMVGDDIAFTLAMEASVPPPAAPAAAGEAR
jgi:polyisoprenoid-binding protein YceI